MCFNRAFEPTRNGWSLQASISFWACRTHPLLAAQLQRYAVKHAADQGLDTT